MGQRCLRRLIFIVVALPGPPEGGGIPTMIVPSRRGCPKLDGWYPGAGGEPPSLCLLWSL